MDLTEKKRVAAAYMPFKTFLSTLEHLKTHGVPNIIDRSIFPSFSGGVQSQIISGLTFLGLIDERGIPHESLNKLVNDVENRKSILRSILRDKYGNLFDADLTRVSPSQFDTLFSPEIYAVNGDTRKKARAFFFAALSYVGEPFSKLLTQRTRSIRRKKPDNGSQNVTKSSTGSAKEVSDDIVADRMVHGKAIKAVQLGDTGKYVWLGTDVNVLELKKGPDRDFILAVSDLFDDYESNASQSTSGDQ